MHCLLLYNMETFNATINIEMLAKCKVRISECICLLSKVVSRGLIEMNQTVHHWLLRAVMFSLAAGAPGLSPSIRITGGIRSAELA